MSIPIIGGIIDGALEWGEAWTEGKVEQTKAKARQKTTQIVEEGETVRKAIAAEAGTKRAIIAKNMRLMRRVTLGVLLMPFLTGALIILGAYLGAAFDWLFTIPWNPDPVEPVSPSFRPLELFWDEVVGGAKEWWVTALQGAFAFLWAGGELTSAGASAGGAVLDSLQRGRESKERLKREERLAERERANRERESRGEPRLPDEPDTGGDTSGRAEDPIVSPRGPRGVPPGGGP